MPVTCGEDLELSPTGEGGDTKLCTQRLINDVEAYLLLYVVVNEWNTLYITIYDSCMTTCMMLDQINLH